MGFSGSSGRGNSPLVFAFVGGEVLGLNIWLRVWGLGLNIGALMTTLRNLTNYSGFRALEVLCKSLRRACFTVTFFGFPNVDLPSPDSNPKSLTLKGILCQNFKRYRSKMT